MKSLIYGYGVTGRSIERYLIKNNVEYEIFDDNKELYISEKFTNELEAAWYVIYCSPGISKEKYKKLDALSQTGIKTDIDIFFNEDSSIKIGITGTNRKSTTCFHLFQLLNKTYKVNLIGNIGDPVLDSLNNGADFSIIELSSQQLDKIHEIQLDYGILLNIAPDHLDYHGNFENYKSCKEKILEAKASSNLENPYKIYEWITGKQAENMRLKDLPFRFEFINDAVVNDSKSTNMHSLQYAIDKANDCFKLQKYNLLLCGNPEKEGFSSFKIDGPDEVFIFGSHSLDIDKCIKHPKKNIFSNLQEVLIHISKAKEFRNILFSPGYPSGNDFKNFEERGEYFNKLLKEILFN
ncbi:Mur ligase family protein [Gammaproteobacteria bacterium]|nr:Mur ligase family protein [Gammaproteobacteria bacterium]